MYNVIATGSKGNAVIYGKSILMDCGISFSKIKPFLKDLKLVLISHIHGDHCNISTLKRIYFEKPSLRFGCGKFVADELDGIKNIDIYESGQTYTYESFKIVPVKLYHDCKNFGYRIIFNDNKKIFHATDTEHLKGITAKEYDVYALEANYDEDTVDDIIQAKLDKGEYAHQIGSKNSHLSIQQAQQFILDNAGKDYKFLPLHQSRWI